MDTVVMDGVLMWMSLIALMLALAVIYQAYCLACDLWVNARRWLERRRIERMLRAAVPPSLRLRVRHR